MTDSFVVTGGAGFIGSHLVDALLDEGNRVVAIDDLSSGEAGRVNPEADFEVLDVDDPEAVESVIDAAAPTVIYHLAAQSSITRSLMDPRRDCDVNVRGTLNLLEAAHRCSAPLVFTSSAGALYGSLAPLPTPERFVPSPIAPYGASKWAAEAYINTWANSSRLPHTVLRLANVYGARQSPGGEVGVVSIFSHALWRGAQPLMYGHGKATRDYVHVDDVVEAMVRASGVRGTFNVSTGVETSVEDVFAVLSAEAGSSVEPELLPLRDGELRRCCVDPSLAELTLGWRARVAVTDGLRSTYRELVSEFEAQKVSSG
jgi:UDP-glucose 4-epimerase